jgi:hypothetical protein
LQSTLAEMKSFARKLKDESNAQRIMRPEHTVETKIAKSTAELTSIRREFIRMLQRKLYLHDVQKAAAIWGFRSAMEFEGYPAERTERAIWDALLKHGETLLNKTLCDILADDGIEIPSYFEIEKREDWWHVFKRSHNVAAYISRQRTAFGRWAQANDFYREHVAPTHKS